MLFSIQFYIVINDISFHFHFIFLLSCLISYFNFFFGLALSENKGVGQLKGRGVAGTVLIFEKGRQLSCCSADDNDEDVATNVCLHNGYQMGIKVF